MKLNLDKLASEAAEFCGLKPSQAAGLRVLFSVVEREAFRDGHKCNNYTLASVEGDYDKYVNPKEPKPLTEAPSAPPNSTPVSVEDESSL